MSCHKYGSLDHFIKECPQWETEKGKGKFNKKNKEHQKPFSRTDMKRVMVAAWGESDSVKEKEQTEEETTHLCHMTKIEDKEESTNTKVCYNTIGEKLT